jgi:hypothetical protein
MSNRRDISSKLVHWTKDENKNDEKAFRRLCKIVKEGRILGTTKYIKGAYKCVCFSEAPLINLKDGLINPEAYSCYSPFGIMFSKRQIFKLGGRPVIYQTEEEFEDLPEKYRWRHVTYEPNIDRPIDFTWEREWRIQCPVLLFSPSCAVIVVLDKDWEQRMISEHAAEQDFKLAQYREILDDEELELYREAFPWRITRLR